MYEKSWLGEVPVAEELLDLAKIDAGIQEQSGVGRPRGMRRLAVPLLSQPLDSFSTFASDDAIHAGPLTGLSPATGCEARAGPGRWSRSRVRPSWVLGYSLRPGEMDTNRAMLV